MKYIYAILLSLVATTILAQPAHLLFITNGTANGIKYKFSVDDQSPRGNKGWQGFVFYQEFDTAWYDSEAKATTKVVLEEIQVNCATNESRGRVLSFRDDHNVPRPSVNADWVNVTGSPSLQGLAFVKLKFCHKGK